MRYSWFYFIFGFCVVATGSIYFHQSIASSEDQRVKNINDSTLSGAKTPVPSVEEMESGLQTKEKDIEKQEQLIKEREERLQVEEMRFKDKIEELQRVQDEIAKIQSLNKAQADEILSKIVKTYESMAPKKAAGVISVMNDHLAVEVLLKMKEKKIAPILDVMDANRAMTLTSLLAQRRPAGRAVGEGQAQPIREPGSKK